MQSHNEAHNKIVDLSMVSTTELPVALARALRSDPDIMVVGEGRDSDGEAAPAMIEASIAGHRIVSRLPVG